MRDNDTITRKVCADINKFSPGKEWRSYAQYSGTSFIRTSINQMLHLLNLLDSQKLFRYSHVKIMSIASNSTLGSDVAGIPSMKLKRKVMSIEKKLEICCRHEMGQSYKRNMVSENRLCMTSFKVRID